MMVGFGGRPNVGLLLSDDERRYLERQVRRHRAPCSLSDRCRIILRCADGLTRLIVLRALWVTPVLAVHA